MARCLRLLAVQAAPLGDPSMTGPFETSLRDLIARFPGTRLVMYPESHLCGSHLGSPQKQAEPLDGKRVQWLRRLARDLEIWLLPGTLYEHAEGGNVYNTALLLSPAGEIAARYRKCFPWRPWETVTPGEEFVVTDVPEVGRVGLSICYDTWFPEAARQLAWLGAEIILQPTFTPTSDRPQELILAQASAIANQVFIVNLNAAAPGALGCSIIAGPEGDVIYQAGEGPVAITQVLDLDRVRTTRQFGTAGLNRPWAQLRPGDRPLRLPAYSGQLRPPWTAEPGPE